jgi:Putative prokaryotic signal transducing protein
MEKSWIKIYTSTNSFQASLVSSVLKDHQIDVVEMNKKDSSYLNFGEIELYIHPRHFDEAIEIIIKNEL